MAILLRLVFNIIGFAGAALVIYTAVAAYTQKAWEPIEWVALWMSTFLTLAGTLLVASSVYFYGAVIPTPPERVSRYYTAPVVIVSSVGAMVALVANGSLPQTLVNGFAMLGLAGGLFRMQPRPPVE